MTCRWPQRRRYRAVFDDLRIDVIDQFGDGDRVVSRWALSGTHRGRSVEVPGITISRFADGRIAEVGRRSSWKSAAAAHETPRT